MRAYIFVLMFVSYLPLIFVTPFVGAMLWCWVSVMSPHEMTYDFLPFSYAAVVAGLFFLSLLVSPERKFPPNTAVTWAMAGLIVFATLAQVTAFDPIMSYPRWDTTWKGLLLSLLTMPLLNSRLRIHAFVWIIVLSLGYFGLKGGIWTFMTGGVWSVGGVSGMIGDNNHLATALVLVLPLMVYMAIHSAQRIIRIGAAAMAFFTMVATLFTYSRGGMLALAASLSVLWWRSSKKAVTGIGVLAFAVVAVQFAPDALWARLGTIQNYELDGSATGRLDIWRVALTLASQHPLAGIGFHGTTLPALVGSIDQNVRPRAIHNSYIEVLTEAGLPAFLCHVTLYVATLFYLRRIRRLTRNLPDWKWAFELASMMQVSVVGYAVGSFFLSLGFYDGWWFVVITATALDLHVRQSLGARSKELSSSAANFRTYPA